MWRGTYGTFTLGPDGAWTYTLHNTDEDTDALGAGEKETDTFAVASADGTTAQVMVTVTGADDAAVIGGDLAGAVTEDAQETGASGTLAVSDVDTALTGEQRRFNAQTDVAGRYGTFTLGPDGAWTYTLHNADPDTDALGAGQEKTEAFTVTSLGGTTEHVVVTVTGADDAAVIGGDTEGAVTEDDVEIVASGTLTVSDPDADQDGFTVQTEVGTYGKFRTGRGRCVDVHAGQHGRAHRRAGCGAGEDGGVHGHEPGRHHRARGGHGDGCGRRGGDWGRADGVGDGGCAADAGERDA